MSTRLYNKIVGLSREMTFAEFMSVVRAINNAHEMGLPKSYDTRFERFCSRPTWAAIVTELNLSPIPGNQVMYVVTRTEGVYLSSVPGDHIEFDKHSMLVRAPNEDTVVANTLRNILVQANITTMMEHCS